MDRRTFLYGAVGALSVFVIGGASRTLAADSEPLLRPPGAEDEASFLALCIKCDKCRSACPQGCIRPAALEDGILNARTPRLNFELGACDFCGKCVDVCPTGALGSLDAAQAKLGVARLEASECASCKKCAEACPYGAIQWDEQSGLPIIDAVQCNGCGKCEFVCPSASFGYYTGSKQRAIHVEPI